MTPGHLNVIMERASADPGAWLSQERSGQGRSWRKTGLSPSPSHTHLPGFCLLSFCFHLFARVTTSRSPVQVCLHCCLCLRLVADMSKSCQCAGQGRACQVRSTCLEEGWRMRAPQDSTEQSQAKDAICLLGSPEPWVVLFASAGVYGY